MAVLRTHFTIQFRLAYEIIDAALAVLECNQGPAMSAFITNVYLNFATQCSFTKHDAFDERGGLLNNCDLFFSTNVTFPGPQTSIRTGYLMSSLP
jgi:hypothetical protein